LTQTQYSQASRQTLTDAIIDTKVRKNLTFEQINEGTGLSLAFVTAALLGQHPLPADAAKVVADKLELGEDAVRLLLARTLEPERLIVRSVADKDGEMRDAAFAASRLARLIELMREEAFEQRPGYEMVVNQLSGTLFALAQRVLLALAQRPRLQPAIAAMFDAPEKPWTLPQLAELCHMSRVTFVRHFEDAIGRSASDVLTEIRIGARGPQARANAALGGRDRRVRGVPPMPRVQAPRGHDTGAMTYALETQSY
jgi:AraC-like DNA-binding protein